MRSKGSSAQAGRGARRAERPAANLLRPPIEAIRRDQEMMQSVTSSVRATSFFRCCAEPTARQTLRQPGSASMRCTSRLRSSSPSASTSMRRPAPSTPTLNPGGTCCARNSRVLRTCGAHQRSQRRWRASIWAPIVAKPMLVERENNGSLIWISPSAGLRRL